MIQTPNDSRYRSKGVGRYLPTLFFWREAMNGVERHDLTVGSFLHRRVNEGWSKRQKQCGPHGDSRKERSEDEDYSSILMRLLRSPYGAKPKL